MSDEATLDQGEVNRRKDHHGRRWFDTLYKGLDYRMNMLETTFRQFTDTISGNRDISLQAQHLRDGAQKMRDEAFQRMITLFDGHVIKCDEKQKTIATRLFILLVVNVVIALLMLMLLAFK